MAYTSQAKGKQARFRPLQVGQEALNQQLVKDEKVIRNMKSVADQHEARDEKTIRRLKHNAAQVNINREANQRLVDKADQKRKSAIEANQRRTRQNAETAIKNIEREAETWKAFSETATGVLKKYAKGRKQALEIEEFQKHYKNPENFFNDSSLDNEVWKKVLEHGALTAKKAKELGLDPSIVTQLSTLSPELRNVQRQKAVISLNTIGFAEYRKRAIDKSGAITVEDKKKVAQAAAFMYATELGVQSSGKLLEPYYKHTLTSNNEFVKNETNSWNNLESTQNAEDAKVDFFLNKSTEDSQHYFNLYQTKVGLIFKADGTGSTNVDVKAAIRKLAENPREIQNLNRFKQLETLPNTRGDVVVNPAISIEKLFSPSEWVDINNKRNETTDNDLTKDKLKRDNYSGKLRQRVEQTLAPGGEWNGTEPGFVEIIAKTPGLNEADKDYLEETYLLTSNAKIDNSDAADNARLQIKSGTFDKAAYDILPQALKADKDFSNAYQATEKLNALGWDKSFINGYFDNFIKNDILKLKRSTRDPLENRTVDPAILDAKADFRNYFKEEFALTKNAELAKKNAETRIVKEITSGEGKWRIDDEYAGAGAKIGEKHFPFWDAGNDDHQVEYPVALLPNKLEAVQDNKNIVLTQQLVTKPYMEEQINNVQNGLGFNITEDIKELKKASGKSYSDIIMSQAKLLGYEKSDFQLEPSIAEEMLSRVVSAEGTNQDLKNFTREIKTIDDAFKANLAVAAPRFEPAMSQTSRWATRNGIETSTRHSLPSLALRPEGQVILQKYFRNDGSTRGGAFVVSTTKTKNGVERVISLPGTDPNEPEFIFLLDGGN